MAARFPTLGLMRQFRGVVTNVGNGFDRLRLYRLDEPGRFVEFPLASARLDMEPQAGSMLTIHRLEIDEGDFDDGFEPDGDVDQIFGEYATSEEALAARIARRDRRDPAKSLDGSAFRCCYTIVYQ